MDLPEIPIPDVDFPVASSPLTAEQAFLLLGWIQRWRGLNTNIPQWFLESIRTGKWIKTCLGFDSPSNCFVCDKKGMTLFSHMGNILEGMSVVDEKIYDRLGNNVTFHDYIVELKMLGVRFDIKEIYVFIIDRLASAVLSDVAKADVFSLMKFIRHVLKINELNLDFLKLLKEVKWLKTTQGCRAPAESFLLPAYTEGVLEVTNLPVVDIEFYGIEIQLFVAELKLLGVVVDIEEAYGCIASSFTFPSPLSAMTNGSAFLIFKCIRHHGASASSLIEKVKDLPWLKTSTGYSSPSKSFLCDAGWGSLLHDLDLPVIDESFYGFFLRVYSTELKAIGVMVDSESLWKAVAYQIKRLSSTCTLSSVLVLSLLKFIKQMNKNMSLKLQELTNCLSDEKWLKTCHGYKCANYSILFDSKWGTISQFVDLPLIDDAFYGIAIYGYRYELKMMGMVVDFSEGSEFVASGLNTLKDQGIVSADGALTLLQCIRSLLSKSSNRALTENFLETLKESKWLKTHMGYRLPKECLLFDSIWESVLEREDGPFIDESYYEAEISSYNDQLKDLGVKSDAEDVCKLISEILFSHTNSCAILRIYRFLNKFRWKPDVDSKLSFRVWIPSKDNVHGQWVSSQVCLVHDSDNLFGSRMHVLDKYHEESVLPIFSSAFGVAENPSMEHYMKLWKDWELKSQRQVISSDCSCFWRHMIDNWSSDTEAILKKNIIKLPACTLYDGGICLVEKNEVFIPDDLQLRKMFAEVSKEPLFMWYPDHSSLSIPLSKLNEIYISLGVQKLSESVHSSVTSFSTDREFEAGERNELIVHGLVKLLMGFFLALMFEWQQKIGMRSQMCFWTFQFTILMNRSHSLINWCYQPEIVR